MRPAIWCSCRWRSTTIACSRIGICWATSIRMRLRHRWRARPLIAAAWVAKNLRLYAFRSLHRFGYACVNFGPPLSLTSYLRERGVDLAPLDEGSRYAETERLATLLMDEIAQVVPVTPVSLVCTALLSFDGEAGDSRADWFARDGARGGVELGRRAYVRAAARRRLLRRRRRADADAAAADRRGRRTLSHRPGRTSSARLLRQRDRTLLRAAQDAGRAGTRSCRRLGAAATAGRARRRPGPRPGADVTVDDPAGTRRSIAPATRSSTGTIPAASSACCRSSTRWNATRARPQPLSQRVDFVTHSMGGLLARGVLSRGTLPNIGRLVMLAPPNHGAQMASTASAFAWAREFFGQALEELRARAGGCARRSHRPAGLRVRRHRGHPELPPAATDARTCRPCRR